VIKFTSSARALARNSRLCVRRSPGPETMQVRLVSTPCQMTSGTHAGLLDAVLLESLLPVAAAVLGLACIVT
jgi:hypothetical protein